MKRKKANPSPPASPTTPSKSTPGSTVSTGVPPPTSSHATTTTSATYPPQAPTQPSNSCTRPCSTNSAVPSRVATPIWMCCSKAATLPWEAPSRIMELWWRSLRARIKCRSIRISVCRMSSIMVVCIIRRCSLLVRLSMRLL